MTLTSVFAKVGNEKFTIGTQSVEPEMGSIIDHEVWGNVPAVQTFHAPWDKKKDNTIFQCYFSARYFYFRFIVEDNTLTLVEPYKGKMDVGDEDRAEIFLSPTPAMEKYYGAEMDPKGRTLDYSCKYYRKFDYKWGFRTLETETRLTETGYVVSGRWDLAEWKELGINPELFYMGVFRADFAGKDVVWYSSLNFPQETPDFHVPGHLFPAGKK